MRSAHAPPDPLALTFRLRTLRTGAWPTLLVCLNCSIYLALTPDRPNRGALFAIIACAAGSAVAIARLPMQRVLSGRLGEPFFLAWTGSLIVMIAVASALDGGTSSPLAPLFFLPLVYAALSYPLRSMVVVCGTNLAAFVALVAVTDEPSGFHVFLLAAGLVNAGWMCAWQSHNHEQHRRLLDVASRTDPLTGVLNRRGFNERCEAELARARRLGGQVALVVLDLDHFKVVNDQRGHAAGDELLRWVGATLRETVRTEDMVARLGGDEFALILSGADPPEPAVARVLERLGERAPTSAGIAMCPRDGDTLDELHRIADADLYAHKHQRPMTPVA